MGELLTSYTSLPNLHPAVVHFPVALLPVAVLFDVLAIMVRNQRLWLDRAATLLYAFAGLAAAVAFWAGRRAADSLVGLSPQEQVLVGEHHDAALFAFWVVGTFAIVRIAIGLGIFSSKGLLFRAIGLPVAVVAVVLIFIAADRGGALVFQHGIAVVSAEEDRELAASGSESGTAFDARADGDDGAEARLVRSGEGVVHWHPLAEDDRALGVVLRPADGSTLSSVEWKAPAGPDQGGLGVIVSGRSMLILPGDFGDVQLEAELEITEFEGSVGLVHHVQSTSDAGLFLVSSTSGEARLVTHVKGEEEVMGKGEVTLDARTLRLAVFAAGRHFRGLQDGEVVVHGHRPPLEMGGCGLILDGRGEVRILSVKITPVDE